MSQEHVEQEDHVNGADREERSFLDQFESLEIPVNIDPRLLELWLYREREELEKQNDLSVKTEKKSGRKLTWLFAAYIGILVMCLVIVLGLVQGHDTVEILNRTCQAFLIYTIVGFFVGWIAESCVTDSVETMLREIIRRSDETAAAANPAPIESVSADIPAQNGM